MELGGDLPWGRSRSVALLEVPIGALHLGEVVVQLPGGSPVNRRRIRRQIRDVRVTIGEPFGNARIGNVVAVKELFGLLDGGVDASDGETLGK